MGRVTRLPGITGVTKVIGLAVAGVNRVTMDSGVKEKQITEETINFYKNYRSGIIGRRELTEEQVAAFKEAFNYFDKNGDGMISAEELAITMKCLGRDDTDAKIEEILKEFDTNGDGMIDVYEN